MVKAEDKNVGPIRATAYLEAGDEENASLSIDVLSGVADHMGSQNPRLVQSYDDGESNQVQLR